ncbi:MAG: alanine racemase [Proteobacteria bacterium]|nr:alanine racemase [Pseudomonadota bacterium]
MITRERAGAVLTVDLGAVAANYRLLRARAAPAASAGVVKADAYGLGVGRVAPALFAEGCRFFFVAHPEEGIGLRAILPAEAEIAVLNGPPPGTEAEFPAHRLIPVLNSLAQVEAYAGLARRRGEALPACLHVDTGMSRLGLDHAELKALVAEPSRLSGLALRYLMTHYACADEPGHPLNATQLAEFRAARARLGDSPTCLANSAGIFLGADYRGDMVRPGIALYGGAPTMGQANPMAAVVRLEGRIIQLRTIDAPRSVGYGATHKVTGRTRIATVAVGYADGYLRQLSNRATGYVGDVPVPLVGRVSMDLTTFDVSALDPDRVRPGAAIELIGPHNPVDAVAAAAGTISYEILTSLGRRYFRDYVGGPVAGV